MIVYRYFALMCFNTAYLTYLSDGVKSTTSLAVNVMAELKFNKM